MRRYFLLLSPLALLMTACAMINDDGSRLATASRTAGPQRPPRRIL